MRRVDKAPNSVLGRMFGRSDGPPAPNPPDLRRPIDEQIDAYKTWRLAGCPPPKRPSEMMRDMLEACTSTDPVRVGALGGHDSAWIRLGVAGNNLAPLWVVWGDCLSTFGLAEDPDPWVASSVILRWPNPPAEIVEAVREAAAHKVATNA